MALQMPSIFRALNSSPAVDNQLKQARPLVVCCSSVSDGSSSSSELPVQLPSSSSSSSSSSAEAYLKSKGSKKLEIGSPIIVTEAPQWIKTATAITSLRVNSGLINAGDVGRIMSRKPKDVWAVRFRIGTYLIDGKYFEALELDEPSL
ncbi:unnamed protein product [Rhodiola kirilowii]